MNIRSWHESYVHDRGLLVCPLVWQHWSRPRVLVPTCFQICLMPHRNRYNRYCEFVSSTRINIVKGKREELRFGERERKGFSNVTKDVVVEQHYRIQVHLNYKKRVGSFVWCQRSWYGSRNCQAPISMAKRSWGWCFECGNLFAVVAIILSLTVYCRSDLGSLL